MPWVVCVCQTLWVDNWSTMNIGHIIMISFPHLKSRLWHNDLVPTHHWVMVIIQRSCSHALKNRGHNTGPCCHTLSHGQALFCKHKCHHGGCAALSLRCLKRNGKLAITLVWSLQESACSHSLISTHVDNPALDTNTHPYQMKQSSFTAQSALFRIHCFCDCHHKSSEMNILVELWWMEI